MGIARYDAGVPADPMAGLSAINAAQTGATNSDVVIAEANAAGTVVRYARALEEHTAVVREQSEKMDRLAGKSQALADQVGRASEALRARAESDRTEADERAREAVEAIERAAAELGEAARALREDRDRMLRETSEQAAGAAAGCLDKVSGMLEAESAAAIRLSEETLRTVQEASAAYEEEFAKLKKGMRSALPIAFGIFASALVAGAVTTFFVSGAASFVGDLSAQFGWVPVVAVAVMMCLVAFYLGAASKGR